MTYSEHKVSGFIDANLFLMPKFRTFAVSLSMLRIAIVESFSCAIVSLSEK